MNSHTALSADAFAAELRRTAKRERKRSHGEHHEHSPLKFALPWQRKRRSHQHDGGILCALKPNQNYDHLHLWPTQFDHAHLHLWPAIRLPYPSMLSCNFGPHQSCLHVVLYENDSSNTYRLQQNFRSPHHGNTSPEG
jgi:hypothetical protein